MSYIVFVFGALLAVVGGLSVYDGYSIITLERGWAEVIAGSVALTGGIVTISLAMVLHKLQALHGLYKTSVRVAPMPPDVITVAPPAVKPPAIKPPALEPLPIPSVAPAMPSPSAAMEPNAGQRRDVPGLWPPARRPAAPVATPPANPVYTPEPEPLEEAVPVSSAMFEEVETSLAASNPPPVEEAAMPQTPRPSAAALSLDEMWKRVTEEIERPILPLDHDLGGKPVPTFPHPAPEPETSPPPPVEAEVTATEHSVDLDAAVEPAPIFEPGPQIEEPAPAGLVEEAAAEAPAVPEPDHVHAEAPSPAHPSPAHVEPPAEEPYAPPPPVEPPMAEPAVIGRYEAEGTSYLMFADGSIEAQSEAGIFRFASMAELKAFIEDKQAVEP
jgi:hypothetical protein